MASPGFESALVIAYLEAHGQRDEDGVIASVNDYNMPEYERQQVERWRERELIPLSNLDAFLMRRGLMLWELEHWCSQHYGRDGFLDPSADPVELVA